ncbi:histidine kinase [Actinoplanes sp. NPDC048796]|uniref:sensor histidine kinase n=1 Tax=unclassified Actinoplanes TaxID=2626549 RepID=UPI0033F75A61
MTQAVERRRLARDLHDGAQQSLVALMINLRIARGSLPDSSPAAAPLDEAIAAATRAIEEIRAFSYGLHPPILSRRGLVPAVRALAARSPVPVTVTDATSGRFDADLESNAYFVIAEALTNVAKHARADQAAVTLTEDDGTLTIVVQDDGVGGACPRSLRDRVAAYGGTLLVESPAGAGTRVTAVLRGHR